MRGPKPAGARDRTGETNRSSRRGADPYRPGASLRRFGQSNVSRPRASVFCSWFSVPGLLFPGGGGLFRKRNAARTTASSPDGISHAVAHGQTRSERHSRYTIFSVPRAAEAATSILSRFFGKIVASRWEWAPAGRPWMGRSVAKRVATDCPPKRSTALRGSPGDARSAAGRTRRLRNAMEAERRVVAPA
jgi:hypothetical protein